MRRAALLIPLVALLALAPAARAQEAATCDPACLAGEACVAGTCMVPACRPACGPGETCVGGTCMVPAHRPVTAPALASAIDLVALEEEAPPAPVVRRGPVLIPQVGVSTMMEEEARDLGPGLRLAALAGGHLTSAVSLGGMLTYDRMNWNVPSGTDASGFMLDVSFAPLFHAGDQRAEFVAGPVLGAWLLGMDVAAAGEKLSASAQGWTVGANIGLFVPVRSKVRVGGLFNFMLRDTLRVCSSLNGAPSVCGTSGPAHEVFGFSIAAML